MERDTSYSRMKAGRYTQLNEGAIHVQWTAMSLFMVSRGISQRNAAFPKANSSQDLDSLALRVRRFRTSTLDDGSSFRGEDGDSLGGSCTLEVGP